MEGGLRPGLRPGLTVCTAKHPGDFTLGDPSQPEGPLRPSSRQRGVWCRSVCLRDSTPAPTAAQTAEVCVLGFRLLRSRAALLAPSSRGGGARGPLTRTGDPGGPSRALGLGSQPWTCQRGPLSVPLSLSPSPAFAEAGVIHTPHSSVGLSLNCTIGGFLVSSRTVSVTACPSLAPQPRAPSRPLCLKFAILPGP